MRQEIEYTMTLQHAFAGENGNITSGLDNDLSILILIGGAIHPVMQRITSAMMIDDENDKISNQTGQ